MKFCALIPFLLLIKGSVLEHSFSLLELFQKVRDKAIGSFLYILETDDQYAFEMIDYKLEKKPSEFVFRGEKIDDVLRI